MAIESVIGGGSGGGGPGGGGGGGGGPGGGGGGGGGPGGGGGGGGSSGLSQQTIQVLDHYLSDLIQTETKVETKPDGTIVILGKGSGNQPQGAVISGGVAVAGEMIDSVMTLSFSLPANISFAFEGLGTKDFQSVQEAKDSLLEKLDSELPVTSTDPKVQAARESLIKAIDNLTNALAAQGISASVIRIIDFTEQIAAVATNKTGFLIPTAEQSILFDMSGSDNHEVFALLLDKIKSDTSLELRGVESAILVGSGTVYVGDNNNTNLQGDNSDQFITGGGGNDTLVGGGGNDTLVGGGGDDIIGFNALGHYTVDIDFSDKLAFQFDGVNSIDDLVSALTDITEADGNVTFEFLDGHASITLVGVTASEVTENLVQFHL